MSDGLLVKFIRESNLIEGIVREPTRDEIIVTDSFLFLDRVTIVSLCELVAVYSPGHRLRDAHGLDVQVGDYVAPLGGPGIRVALEIILQGMTDPWQTHIAYEHLHPFTDGNGRSGRALWLWQMKRKSPNHFLDLGFLHRFYYQTLERVAP